jgi:adenine-specific DNA methylase
MTPKKLIEVALPLNKINVAATREKSIRHGLPSTLHLWWARRPLAAVRAVIFAQMVNDPCCQQGCGLKYGVNKEKAAIERERLFKIIEEFVLVDGEQHGGPYYVRKSFTQEQDWAVTSINLDLDQLLRGAENI